MAKAVRYYDDAGNGPFVSDSMTDAEAEVFAAAHTGAEIISGEDAQPTPEAVQPPNSAPPVVVDQTAQTIYEPGVSEPAVTAPAPAQSVTVPGPATVPAEGGAEFSTPASVQPSSTPLFDQLTQPGGTASADGE